VRQDANVQYYDISGLDSITTHLGDTGWGDMNLIDQAQDRDYCRARVNTVVNHLIPSKCWEVLGNLSRKSQLYRVIIFPTVPQLVSAVDLRTRPAVRFRHVTAADDVTLQLLASNYKR
jgi:hypothetical protein